MVALDDGARALAGHGLDDVGIERALGEEVHLLDLPGFLVEDLDEGVADDLALSFGILDALQAGEEALRGVHDGEVEIEIVDEQPAHLLDLALAQQAVVDEDAVQVPAYGPVQEHGDHGGVDAAGEGADDVAVPHLLAGLPDHALHEGGHGPVGDNAADREEEVAQHGLAFLGVVHLGVELHGEDPALGAGHGRHFQGGRAGNGLEAGRRRHDLVAVAHPDAGGFGHAVPELAVAGERKLGRPVLAGLGAGELAAQGVCQQLHAVADAEHRHPELEQALVQRRRVLAADAGGTAGQDDRLGPHGLHLLGRHVAGVDFGVDAGFAHAAGDELGHLGAVVDDDDFAGHGSPPGKTAAPPGPSRRGGSRRRLQKVR